MNPGLEVLRYLTDFRYFDRNVIGSRDSLNNAIKSRGKGGGTPLAR